jgi:5-formaminoimidazole-4-carboxamide-1-beta-D-ribofuranosyl 5'-monophosphate synthetase
LGIEKEAKQFQKRLFEQGGINQPWVLKIPNVNKGKGVFMLAPNSEELKHVMKRVERDKQDHNYIIQQYICNEMTWQRRKFDVRFFWLVSSTARNNACFLVTSKIVSHTRHTN